MNDIIKNFIVDEKEFSNKDSERLIKEILDYVKVSKEGRVLFTINSINNTDKIGLILIARFLANNFEKTIPQEVSISEIMDFCSLSNKIVGARLSDLTKQRIIKRIKPGKYIVIPYQIEFFIKKVNKTYGGIN